MLNTKCAHYSKEQEHNTQQAFYFLTTLFYIHILHNIIILYTQGKKRDIILEQNNKNTDN